MRTAAKKPASSELHRPFSWLHASLHGNDHAEFVALTRDVCYGAALVAQMKQAHELDIDGEQPTILSINDMERLSLAAQRSLTMLGQFAEREIEWLNERAQKKVGAA